MGGSVSDPYHFDADRDPDPGIRIRDDGSEVTFDSVNRIFPLCYARLYFIHYSNPKVKNVVITII